MPHFTFHTHGHSVRCDLDKEGDGRYLAYMSIPDKRIHRIRSGTVLGGRGHWSAEPVGSMPAMQGRTLKCVSERLADWFVGQPGPRNLLQAHLHSEVV